MNDIDALMLRVDEINSKAANDLVADDIDTIIKYHRLQRQRKASGEKPAKPTVDLEAILKVAVQPKAPSGLNRRF